MAIHTWTSIGGWYAAAVTTYIAAVLLFTKPKYTAHDSEQRKQMMNVVICFGWIPLGAAVIILEPMWAYVFDS